MPSYTESFYTTRRGLAVTRDQVHFLIDLFEEKKSVGEAWRGFIRRFNGVRIERQDASAIIKRFNRRPVPNDPFPYPARADEEFELAHYTGPDGRVDRRTLPWVLEYRAELAAAVRGE